MSVCLSVCLSLSVSFHLSLSLCLSSVLSVPLSVSASSLSHCPCLPFCLSDCLCLSPPASLHLSFNTILTLYNIYVCVPACLSFCLSTCLLFYLSIHPSSVYLLCWGTFVCLSHQFALLLQSTNVINKSFDLLLNKDMTLQQRLGRENKESGSWTNLSQSSTFSGSPIIAHWEEVKTLALPLGIHFSRISEKTDMSGLGPRLLWLWCQTPPVKFAEVWN